MSAPTAAELQEKQTGRVEAFSDGVFAIAVTLLVLELKAPRGLTTPELRDALLAQWPSYLAFLISFASIAIMWLHHHRVFGLLHRVDHPMLLLNSVLLLAVTVIPFPTALVAANLGKEAGGLAVQVYAFVMGFVAVSFNLLWRYVSSPTRGLLRSPHDSPQVKAIHRQYRWGPLVYLVIVVSSFVHPTLTLVLLGADAVWHSLPAAPPKA